MVGKLLCKSEELGTLVFVNEWYRDTLTQARYVKEGRSKTIHSKHIVGLAVDILFLEDVRDDGKVNFPPGKYKELGEYWEKLGGRWGGRFGDNPDTEKIEGWDACHFEYTS
jgi:hypothetical protein